MIKENISNFSFTSSQNAIRTIYHKSGSLFVSGTDEIIHMLDVNKKISEGDLMTYSGSINDIKINNNYLIVAGENNTIPIWRMNDFNNIIELKGHKKAINSIDIHSSGGILVSASRDKCVIIFDLLTGRKIEKIEFGIGVENVGKQKKKGKKPKEPKDSRKAAKKKQD